MRRRRRQAGGFLPLMPIAGAIGSALLGNVAEKVFSRFTKRKQSGSGIRRRRRRMYGRGLSNIMGTTYATRYRRQRGKGILGDMFGPILKVLI